VSTDVAIDAKGTWVVPKTKNDPERLQRVPHKKKDLVVTRIKQQKRTATPSVKKCVNE